MAALRCLNPFHQYHHQPDYWIMGFLYVKEVCHNLLAFEEKTNRMTPPTLGKARGSVRLLQTGKSTQLLGTSALTRSTAHRLNLLRLGIKIPTYLQYLHTRT